MHTMANIEATTTLPASFSLPPRFSAPERGPRHNKSYSGRRLGRLNSVSGAKAPKFRKIQWQPEETSKRRFSMTEVKDWARNTWSMVRRGSMASNSSVDTAASNDSEKTVDLRRVPSYASSNIAPDESVPYRRSGYSEAIITVTEVEIS